MRYTYAKSWHVFERFLIVIYKNYCFCSNVHSCVKCEFYVKRWYYLPSYRVFMWVNAAEWWKVDFSNILMVKPTEIIYFVQFLFRFSSLIIKNFYCVMSHTFSSCPYLFLQKAKSQMEISKIMYRDFCTMGCALEIVY